MMKMAYAIAVSETTRPQQNATRRGAVENDMMPSIASPISFG